MKYLFFTFFLLPIVLLGQIVDPISGTTTTTTIPTCDFGPRNIGIGNGSVFHPGFDFPVAGNSVGSPAKAVETGNIVTFDFNSPDAFIQAGNWRYMHIFVGQTSDNLWDYNSGTQILFIKNNQGNILNVYATTTAYPSQKYTDPSTGNEIIVQRSFTRGDLVFRAGPYDGGPHLHIDRGYGSWENPYSFLPRSDNNPPTINNVRLQRNISGVATLFPSNIIFNSVIIQSDAQATDEHDLDNLVLSISRDQTNYEPIFHWRYTGSDHIDVNRTTGVSNNLPQHNIRIDFTNFEQDIREGIYPIAGVHSRDIFKYNWNSQQIITGTSNVLNFSYLDGTFYIRCIASDLTNHQSIPNTTPVILDNLRPYIEKIEVRKNQSAGELVYSGGWTWSSNALSFAKSVTGTITANTPLFIKVYTSEPMQNVALSAFGMATPTNNTTPLDAARKVWEFSIPAASVTAGLKTITVKSTSLDLAGNGIEGFTATSPLSGSSIPKHQNGGTWLPAANPRDDVVHTVDVVSASGVADFNGSPTSIGVGNSVNFTDASTNNPISWSWTFQGGTPATSSAQNPVITYNTDGTFSVTLVATYASGVTSTKSKTGYITVSPSIPTTCDFTISSNPIIKGEPVTFTDISTPKPTSWSWTFQGGTPSFSTVQNPVILYNTAGAYSVTLTINNSISITKPITVVEKQWIISGTTFKNVTEISGVLVKFNPEGWYTTSGSGGFYSYSVPNGWTGTIKASKEGLYFSEQPVSPVTSDKTINLHGTPVPAFKINYSPTNPIGGQFVTFWLTPERSSSDYVGIWNWGDNSEPESDEGIISEMKHPFKSDAESDKSYTVSCTIHPKDGSDPFTLLPVTIIIPMCDELNVAAEYTNGCSTVRLGETAFLTDISSPYNDLGIFSICWDWVNESWEQYHTSWCKLTDIDGEWTDCSGLDYPPSRIFSKIYPSKGHKAVRIRATRNLVPIPNDAWYGFNVVDCNSTVYSNALSNCTYDNWGGVESYWAGTIIFAGSAGNYVVDPNKKLEFSACNGIELKPGFSANPTGDSYLLLTANDPCLSLVSPKGTIEPDNSENNFIPIISNEKALDADLSLKVFPNPTSHFLNIVYTGDISKILSIEIISPTGELMLKQTSGFSTPLQLNVEHFAPGAYCVRLVTASKAFSKVFIKS